MISLSQSAPFPASSNTLGGCGILAFTEKCEWDSHLRRFPRSDVFHKFDYVTLEARRQKGRALLLSVELGGSCFAIPLILREIPQSTGLLDATCAYGYNGFLTTDGVTEEQVVAASSVLQSHLRGLGCVSLFNRGHPFLECELPGFVTIGSTLAVDLSTGEDVYDQGLSSGHRYEIRKLAQSNVRVEIDRSLTHLKAFHLLYLDTMERRNSAAAYKFDESYVRDLLRLDCDEVTLNLAWAGDLLVSGMIVFRQGEYAHYHLSASVIGATKYPAIKLLLDSAIRDEIRLGKRRWFHLGGGLGGAVDSLHHFKKNFGAVVRPFRTSKLILMEDAYRSLTQERNPSPDNTFFPAYRA